MPFLYYVLLVSVTLAIVVGIYCEGYAAKWCAKRRRAKRFKQLSGLTQSYYRYVKGEE